MGEQKQLRGAVLGYGPSFGMGRHHAQQMKSVDIEVVAVCDLDPARRAAAKADFPEIETFASASEMLANPDIDLVTVVTPHNVHAELAKQVLLSGKNCIIEKPMCIQAEDAEALVQLSRSQGKMLSVYHNRRWDGWYLAMKEVLERGVLGNIFHVEMFFGGYHHPGHWWRSEKVISGGAFYDWGAHYLDWLLTLIPGKIDSVRGFVQNHVWNDVTNEDHIDSILQFASGTVAHVQMSSIAHAGKPQKRFLGTTGAVVDYGDGVLHLHTQVEGYPSEARIPYKRDDWNAYYRNIADHLRDGAELEVKPEQARRTIAVIETTERSSAQRQELAVPYE